MNHTQQALFRQIRAVVGDLSQRIERVRADAQADVPLYRDSVIRLNEMKREVDDIVSNIREEVEVMTPSFRVNVDRHLEDLQERLVALQTQLNSYRWQYGGR